MIVEVIATSVEDAIAAEQGGAARLELCSALSEDGLTPSIGLAKSVVKAVGIPVYVMVRPHNRGFQYTNYDVEVMLEDIRLFKQAGVAGIVIGALTDEQKVDTLVIERLLREAVGMGVTFHRAFDMIDDQVGTLDVLASYPQIERILTSGGMKPAPKSTEQLKRLVEKAANTSLRIMAGHGMTPEALVEVVAATGVREVHFGSAVRHGRSFQHPIDAEIIKAVTATQPNMLV